MTKDELAGNNKLAASEQKIPRLLKDRFFLVIIALIVFQAIFLSLYDIAKVGWLPAHEEWGLTDMAIQRGLFMATVALTAWRFGFKWAVAACFTIGLFILAHVGLEESGPDAWLEAGIVITFGLILSWLISAYIEGRKLTEQSERNFRNSIDGSPLGISIVTKEGKLIYTNQAFLALYGYGSMEELRAVPLKRRYTPQSYAEHRVRQEKMRKRKAVPASYELSIIGKDGEVKHLSVSWDKVFWDGEQRFQVIYQDITERKRSEKILRNIAEGVSAKMGEAFFQSLVKHLAETLGVNYALIGELVGGKEERVRTIAVYACGELVENFEYSLADTPCQNVMGQSLCCYPSGVQQQFPKDRLLVEMGVEGYIGTPLFASSGGALGLIAVMDGKPIGNTGTAEVMLRIFAARASAELERMKAEEEVRESEERYHTLIDMGGEVGEAVVMEQDTEHGEAIQTFVSDAWPHITGYSKEELLGMSFFDLVHPRYRQASIERHRGRMKGKAISEHPDEKSIIRKDGTEVPIESVVAAATYKGKRVHIAYIRDITDRKEAEEEIRESEERYRELFELAPNGIITTDLKGVITSCNTAAQKLGGYSKDELVGKHFAKVAALRAKDITKYVKIFYSFLKGRVIPPFEIAFYHKDGSPHWVEVYVSALKVDGKKIGIIAILADTTERKKMEEALRKSEEHLRSIFESANDAIISADSRGHVISWNKMAETMFGYSVAEIIGKPLTVIMPERFRQAHKNGIKRVVSTGKTRIIGKTVEVGGLKKDGSKFPIEISIATWKMGDEVFFTSNLRDITERRKVDAEVRKNREYIQSILDNSIDLICTVKRDGALSYFNRSLEPMLGYKAEELSGRPFIEYVVEDERPGAIKSWKRALKGISGTYETKIIKADGEIVDVRYSYSPLKEYNEVLLVLKDITERKRAEEREKRLQRELDLSSRLASVGQLAAGVAHEINNPLTGIIGFSQLLMDKSTDEGVKGDLERIHNEGLRAAKVVRNLLAFARRSEPKKEYSDINDILQKTLELAYDLKGSNIKVVTDLAPGLPRTRVDFGQIQQVFLNIVVNAAQAMVEANRGGKLTIKTQEMQDYIRVSFTDDGPGIRTEKLDRLFEPFFTTRGEKGGTGLGLSVCHGIVADHGGRIYARSKPGKETIFFVELPLTGEG